MKQIDEIYQYILKKELRQSANGERQEELGVTATEIEEYFHIVRNNASTMLNRLTAEKKLVQITGTALFSGDIAPDVPSLSGGTLTVFGQERRIEQGCKNRNPDGTVNFCSLEVV